MSCDKTVSLCIIAKDEENFISSCINSARPLVDEIILVDTGSADRTAELARQAGAKAFSFLWADDFSAARNFSLDQASGHWVLVLDADEVLEPVSPDEFRSLLEAPAVEGYFVNIQSYLGEGGGTTLDQVVRLFKNRPEYRFEGDIHEQVATSIKKHNHGGGLSFSKLLVHHFGYLDRQVREKNKHKRNISVIKKGLRKSPGNAFLHYSLGIEYYQSGQTARGNEQMEKALRLLKGDEGYLRDVLVSLGLGLLQAGDSAGLAKMLGGALAMLPGDPDLHLIRGLLEIREGRHLEAAEELKAALAGGAKAAAPDRIYSLLGDAFMRLGRYGDAEKNYLAALHHSPAVLYPLTRILGLKQEGKSLTSWTDLISFAQGSVKKRLREDLLRVGETSLALVLSLLEVVEAAGGREAGSTAPACLEYRRALEEHFTGPEPLKEYMLLCSEEMLLHGEAACRNISCPLYSPLEVSASLATALLDLTVRTICPLWLSLPLLESGKD